MKKKVRIKEITYAYHCLLGQCKSIPLYYKDIIC